MKKIFLIISGVIALVIVILFIRIRMNNSTPETVFEIVKDNTYKETIDNYTEPVSKQQSKNTNPTNASDKESLDAKNVILGTWIGEMSGKKLTIVIEKISGNELFGYNILGGNKRKLTGSFTEGFWAQPCTKAFDAVLKEPGDDKWDGVFKITFVGYEDEKETNSGPECLGNIKGSEAPGEWKSNNGKMEHSFNLEKK